MSMTPDHFAALLGAFMSPYDALASIELHDLRPPARAQPIYDDMDESTAAALDLVRPVRLISYDEWLILRYVNPGNHVDPASPERSDP